jgi:hypothetical protein
MLKATTDQNIEELTNKNHQSLAEHVELCDHFS